MSARKTLEKEIAEITKGLVDHVAKTHHITKIDAEDRVRRGYYRQGAKMTGRESLIQRIFRFFRTLATSLRLTHNSP